MMQNGISLVPDNYDDETGEAPMNFNPIQQIGNLIFNEMMTRSDLYRRLSGDGRRNLNRECHYPDVIRPQDYQNRFDRNGVAARAVKFEPLESWKSQPEIYEDEDEDNETPFETAWKELDNSLGNSGLKNYLKDPDGKMSPIWHFLRKVDIRSRIGSYGVLLYGLNDNADYSLPVDGVEELNSEPVDIYPDRYTGTDKDKKRTKITSGDNIPEDTKPVKNSFKQRIEFVVNSMPKTGDGVYVLNVDTKKLKSGKKLLYLRAFSETQAQIVRWESNPTSPRYGMPVMYLITMNDPSKVNQYSGVGMDKSSMYVHWTRVEHIAETLDSDNEALAVPVLQDIYNYCLNIEKINGASGEGYWKGAFHILAAETNPQLGGDVEVDEAAVKRSLQNVEDGLQRSLLMKAMTLKSVAPTVTDPTPHIDNNVKLICITKGWPKRIFEGSERGELASSQDEQAHLERMENRQMYHIAPNIIAPFVNRCIAFGLLPEPKDGYQIAWAPLRKETPQMRAQRFLTKVQAYGAAMAQGLTQWFTEKDIMTKLDGDFTNKEADAIIEAATEAQEEAMNEQLAQEQARMQQMSDAEYVDQEDVDVGLTPDDVGQAQQLSPPEEEPAGGVK
jgi:hypothetical protein